MEGPMQHKEGVFIVIEGSDGSGKSTQFQLLTERLETAGYDVATFKFPQYNEPSSYFVKQYLAGAYGAADEVGPYTASLFYALDRFAAADQIRSALAEGKVVLVDRFTGSNMAHQGTKFYHADQRRGYFIWLDNLEFEMLRIPRPDINFVLHVPAGMAQKLLTKSEKKRDIHEIDAEHLKRSVEVFNDLCQLFPKDFARIDSVRNDELLSPETINNLIWEKTFPLLPTQPRSKKTPAKVSKTTPAITADNAYIEQTNTGVHITAAGRAFLEKAITNATGTVYAFNDQLQATAIATAIVHAAQSESDVRTTILRELAPTDTPDDNPHIQTSTDNTTMAIQQFVGRHIVIEHSSSLLTEKIAWGRLGAYVTPSTQFMHYDVKDEHGQYKYHTPDYFKGQLAQDYRMRMDEVFENYTTIVLDLTRYLREHTDATEETARTQAYRIARAVLPVAAKSTISVFASVEELTSIVQHLLRDPLPESQAMARQLLTAVQQAMPVASTIDEAQEIASYRADALDAVKQLAETHLPDHYAIGITEPVVLTSFWPRNELDLVPDMLYEQSNLPLTELRNITDKWSYAQKAEVLTAYIGKRENRLMRPGRALEKAHYSWDILCDYATFRDLQRHRIVDDLEWQQLTPRYGYEVPTIIEDANLADTFEDCFDISLELHSILHEAGYPLEAQYATLFGHRLRWKVTYNAREAFHIHELRTSEQAYPETKKLVQQLHEKLAEVHPMIAEAMQFVGKN